MKAVWPFPESTRRILESYFDKEMKDADAILYKSESSGVSNYRLRLVLENGHSWDISASYDGDGLDEFNVHLERMLLEQGFKYRKVTRIKTLE